MARAPRAPQTPGATPSDSTAGADTAADASATAGTDGEGAAEAGDGDATAPVKGAKKASKGALAAGDYAKLHSSEVDAKTLTRSVLCSDGWVCPDRPPVAPRA